MFGLACTRKFLCSNWVQNALNSSPKQISTAAFPLQFKLSAYLWAEPMKKKKKVDPMIEKRRIERKKKKIMKEIRKLQKLDKQFKPVKDLEAPECLLTELERRVRVIEISKDKSEERTKVLKAWSRYKLIESIYDSCIIQKLQKAQETALNELRLESEELYQAAVQIDPDLIPMKYSGPTETPPKEDYPIPDGAYVDVSRKWV